MTFIDLPDVVKNKFCDLASSLSPENLSCDGELSREQIMNRYHNLMFQWRKLELHHGVDVTENEVWDWLT